MLVPGLVMLTLASEPTTQVSIVAVVDHARSTIEHMCTASKRVRSAVSRRS